MKKRDFLNDVEHEVKMLKKYGTKKELSKLDFEYFNPESPSGCIYGQITGYCESERAKTLMNKSCIRVMDTGPITQTGNIIDNFSGHTFSNIKQFINGANKGQGWSGSTRIYQYFSALEAYITLKGAKNKHIIKFLKGEVKTLKLN